MLTLLTTAQLLLVSIIVSVTSNLPKAFFSKKVSASPIDVNIYNIIMAFFTGVTILLINGGFGTFSVYSLIMGIIFGLMCALQLVTNMKALEIGPFSYTTVIISLSAIIPTLSGVLFFGEPAIDVFQYIGIALMITCILMSGGKKKDDEEKRISAKWLLLCFASAILNGGIGVFQKIHQASSHKEEIGVFLISAFVVSVGYSTFNLLTMSRKPELRAQMKFKPSFFAIALPIFGGISYGTCHVVNLYLSGVVDAVIFFPLVNLIPFAISTIVATIAFKEKLPLRKWIGIGIGVLSTAFVTGIVSALFK